MVSLKLVENGKGHVTLASEYAAIIKLCGGTYVMVVLELIPTLDSCPTPTLEGVAMLVDVWA